MKILKYIINIVIEILILILIYIVLDKVLSGHDFIKWIIIILTSLIMVYFDLDKINISTKENSKELFNTYYINYPKVFEIVMLINNKIKINSEETVKKQKDYKQKYGIESTYNVNTLPLKGSLGGELLELTSHEYKEIQEIKNTNSTYLREILKKCKSVKSLENLKNGDLIKIDNVKLKVLNNDEILEANSIISGAFKDNIVDAYSNGTTLKVNVNALTNMILKDYKYYLIGQNNKEKFYIDIPMKAEKEFENEYSIYDLEIGLVNIIGIYRTETYEPKNKTTYSKLQELGAKQETDVGEMKSSKKSKQNNGHETKVNPEHYVDLIAIIQDLSFNNGEN